MPILNLNSFGLLIKRTFLRGVLIPHNDFRPILCDRWYVDTSFLDEEVIVPLCMCIAVCDLQIVPGPSFLPNRHVYSTATILWHIWHMYHASCSLNILHLMCCKWIFRKSYLFERKAQVCDSCAATVHSVSGGRFKYHYMLKQIVWIVIYYVSLKLYSHSDF